MNNQTGNDHTCGQCNDKIHWKQVTVKDERKNLLKIAQCFHSYASSVPIKYKVILSLFQWIIDNDVSDFFDHKIVRISSASNFLASFFHKDSIKCFEIENSVCISIIGPHTVSPHNIRWIYNCTQISVFIPCLIVIALQSESIISWIHNDENSRLIHHSKVEIFNIHVYWWYWTREICADAISSHYQFLRVSRVRSTHWKNSWIDKNNKTYSFP